MKKLYDILEKIEKEISMIFIYKDAKEAFEKHEDFHDLYYDLEPSSEEEAETLYDMKAALAEADMRDEAKNLMYDLENLDEEIKKYKNKLSKKLLQIWNRKFNKIMKTASEIERGVPTDWEELSKFGESVIRLLDNKN